MAWQTIDGETVLLNVEGRELMGLNAVGARVWELADGTHALDEIARTIADEFAVEAGVATADVERFVDELVAAGALVMRS
jgi:hypothetical protein